MNSPEPINPPPWWKQFWPWFLISLPAGTIVAAMYTINLAVETNDGLVSQDYYKDGLAIHLDASAVKLAKEQGIEAELIFEPSDKTVTVDVSSQANKAFGKLQLALHHPTQADRDHLLDLKPIGPSVYQASFEQMPEYAWNVELLAKDAGWKLPGRINLKNSNSFILR